jgi:hypothetical protein
MGTYGIGYDFSGVDGEDSLNTWKKLTIEHLSSVTYMYIDGVQLASNAKTLNTGNTNTFHIGSTYGTASQFNGYLSNFVLDTTARGADWDLAEYNNQSSPDTFTTWSEPTDLNFYITIDHTKVAGDLTDFVVYVDLADMPAAFWSRVKNGGGDIRVYKYDGTTELAREVVSCNTASDTGEMHFKYTGTLSSSVDTIAIINVDGLRGDYDVTATYGRNAVWSNLRAVYHLENVNDSTANGYNLSNPNSATFPSSQKIGAGVELDNTNKHLRYTSNNMGISNGNLSMTCWVKYKNDLSTGTFPNGIDYFLGKEDASTQTGNGMIYEYNGGSRRVTFVRSRRGVADYQASYTVTLGTSDWHRFSYTYNSSTGNVKGYHNAAEVVSFTAVTSNGSGGSSTEFAIGRLFNNFYFPDAYFDEVHIDDAVWTPEYEETSYNNQGAPSTFYSISEENIALETNDVVTISEYVEAQLVEREVSVFDTVSVTESVTLTAEGLVTVEYLQDTVDVADLASYSLTGVNFGTADSSRFIIIGITSRKVGSATTLNSVTIGGVSATIIDQINNSVTNTNFSALAIAHVPTGTSGTVEINFADTMVRLAIQTYRAVGIDPSPVDFGSSTAADPTANIDVPENGVVVATGGIGTSTTASWSGLTEDVDDVAEGFMTYTSAHADWLAPETSRIITIDFGASGEQTGVFASFGPLYAFEANVFDALTITESVSNQRTIQQSVSDVVSITENVQLLKENLTSVADAITITEATTQLQSVNVSVDDLITIFDVAEGNTDLLPIENISITEFVDAQVEDFTVNATEVISITDTTQLLQQFLASVFEVVTSTDDAAISLAYATSVSDSVTITDPATVGALQLTSFLFDALTIQENVSSFIEFDTTVHEAIGIDENVSSSIAYITNVFDTVSITDYTEVDNYRRSIQLPQDRYRGTAKRINVRIAGSI